MRLEKGTPPEWLTELLEVVSDKAFKPECACGPLGYLWVPPRRKKGIWKVSIFPTAGEIIEAGPADGRLLVPGFQMALLPILNLFDDVKKIGWTVPSEYTGELDGPGIVIEGKAYGLKLSLYLFEEPPDHFAPTIYFDRIKGETRVRQRDTKGHEPD